jgi:uncharacterized membrane protein
VAVGHGFYFLGGLIIAGYLLSAVGAFVARIVAAVAVFRRYEGTLLGERDQRLQEAASKRTLAVIGISAAIVFPLVTVLWALGVIDWPACLTPIAFFVALLSFVHVGSVMHEPSRTS